jgi:hypothetical protein
MSAGERPAVLVRPLPRATSTSTGPARPLAHLAGGSGHWNSPIVADVHVVEPEGNANDHAQSGALEIFSAR